MEYSPYPTICAYPALSDVLVQYEPHVLIFGLHRAAYELMSALNMQVYALEKVLKIKKDPVTQVLFMDEAMKVRVYFQFW